MDSQVLLHGLWQLACAGRLGATVHAVHVHHGLHAAADAWLAQCRAVCAQWHIPLRELHVDARPAAGESPEAAARQARYSVLAECLAPGEVLLTAHHQEDQAETVLLQLLRGAGVSGLAAMPVVTAWGPGQLLRPLLGVAHAELMAYARRHDLQWVDDPSNAQLCYDRNYLRHEIMPRLRARWPACARSLARSATHAAAAADLVARQAAADVAALRLDDGAALSVAALRRLDGSRARAAVRYWLVQRGLPVPGSRQLEHVFRDLVAARADAQPCVCWPGAEVRRYRDALCACAPRPAPDPARVLPWDLDTPLALPDQGGYLYAQPVRGAGLRAALCAARPVTVRFRRGGERCRRAAGGPSQAVKKLLQSHGVPPWERPRIPFIYVGEDLAAVGNLWICEPFQAAGDEPGIAIRWQADAF